MEIRAKTRNVAEVDEETLEMLAGHFFVSLEVESVPGASSAPPSLYFD